MEKAHEKIAYIKSYTQDLRKDVEDVEKQSLKEEERLKSKEESELKAKAAKNKGSVKTKP